MLLLTGATGQVGTALLRRLTAAGTSVRCLVRDPRRLGDDRVRVQIAIGDLADPTSFRHALRGVETVVHLAATGRDQPRGSIEELGALATWRLVRAAERARVSHFVLLSALGASPSSGSRFLRSKWLAERAVAESGLGHAILAPSLTYSAAGPWMRRLERVARLAPLVPIAGGGKAHSQPIWAEDVADCLVAALAGDGASGRRVELAGPDALSYAQVAHLALRGVRRDRPLLHVPAGAARRTLALLELLAGPTAMVTRDEADFLQQNMTSRTGTAGAESLGITPRPMRAVLGAA
ncbi:MAG: NAD(P)H-binding protein [Solirubrobacteraceae bacterium]